MNSGDTCIPKYLHKISACVVKLYILMTSSYSFNANDVIWLICKLGSKTKIFMQITNTSMNNVYKSRVTGTMVACSSSVRAVARSNLSQVPPPHMHVGK